MILPRPSARGSSPTRPTPATSHFRDQTRRTPTTLSASFQRFSDWASEQPRRNYQLAILRRREPQALVGCCGLRGAGCEAGTAELGIELAPAYWGRHGYAIEVGRALLEFGFGDLGLQEIYGVSVNANARIARLAEWFGAEAVATRSGAAWMSARGWNETEWRITRDRWQALAGRITPRWT